MFAATPTAKAQNTLGYPSSHKLVALSGESLGRWQSGEGVVLENGPRGPQITLAPGFALGRVEYRISIPSNTREIIPSWSGRAPGGSGFRVKMSTANSGGWFEAGSWGNPGGDAPATRRLTFADGSQYFSSYLKSNAALSEVLVAVEFAKPAPDGERPALWLLSLSCAPETQMRKPLLKLGGHSPVRGRPIDSGVPFMPQAAVGRKDWVERTCSPAVACMMLARHGIRKSVLDLATQTYDPPADAFGVWNRAVMSVAEHGFDGYVTRLRSWNEVHQTLAVGSLVGASIRMEPGEVRDPLNQFGRRLEGTKGHIILIRGINADGSVVTNDPASKDHGGSLTWNPQDLGRAWFEKGGVAYILNR